MKLIVTRRSSLRDLLSHPKIITAGDLWGNCAMWFVIGIVIGVLCR